MAGLRRLQRFTQRAAGARLVAPGKQRLPGIPAAPGNRCQHLVGELFVDGAKILVRAYDLDRVFPGESAVEVLSVPRNQQFDSPSSCSGHMRVVIGVRPVNPGDQPSVALDRNAGVRKELPDRGGNRCGRVWGAVTLPDYEAYSPA